MPGTALSTEVFSVSPSLRTGLLESSIEAIILINVYEKHEYYCVRTSLYHIQDTFGAHFILYIP